MKTTGLYHVQIDVSDLERSLAFYTDLLGMEEAFRAGGNLVFLKTPGSNDLLTLHPVDGAVDPAAGGLQHIGFSISPEDHEAAVAEAKAFGAEVVDISEPGRDRRPYVYIKDPDGYVIELS